MSRPFNRRLSLHLFLLLSLAAVTAAGSELPPNVPELPSTAEAVDRMVNTALATADRELDAIAKLPSAQMSLANTAAAFDHTRAKVQSAAAIAGLLGEVSADASLRSAALKAQEQLRAWNVGADYRADVYRVLKDFAARQPPLAGEDAKLLAETLRDFRRNGLDLPLESRQELERLRKELARTTGNFNENINSAQAPLIFTRAELEGMPSQFLENPEVKMTDGQFRVRANVTWQFNAIEENARREETRRKVYDARDSLAKSENVPLLNRMLTLRNTIALRLGYKSWADYQLEIQMAKNEATAERFVGDIAAALEPRFRAEVRELQKMKAEDKNNAPLMAWDWRYFQKQRQQTRFAIDPSELRSFFPFEAVEAGMFATFARVFGLTFKELLSSPKWTPRMQLFAVSDSESGNPLGLLYLDLFTHEGKTNGGGASELFTGYILPNGKYQRPVAVVLLNFAPPTESAPSLLTPEEVETLFHEFGHALHAVLTRTKYARFSGTNVPRDFVEAPSQMLQNWVWDSQVLESFARDYREPSRRIPLDLVRKLREVKRESAGIFYRRQCAFALADLALHSPHPPSQRHDCARVSNSLFAKTFLPIDDSTAFIASFRGMDGYDAGYYGYMWSEALAADMASVFEQTSAGYLDRSTGRRLRREIYESGSSRDVNEAVEKFLGRKTSPGAFLEKLGIERPSSGAQPRGSVAQP